MIRLKIIGGIGDRYASLYPNTQITFEINTGLFVMDVVEGSYSYNFNLPADPNNRRIFGSPEEISNVADIDQERDAELYFAGELFDIGKFTITEATNKQYRGFFKANAGDLASKGKEKVSALVADDSNAVDNTLTLTVLNPLIHTADEPEIHALPFSTNPDHDTNYWKGLLNARSFFSAAEVYLASRVDCSYLYEVFNYLINNLGYITIPDIPSANAQTHFDSIQKLTLINRFLSLRKISFNYLGEDRIEYRDNFVEAADRMPDMTLSEFLASFKAITGMNIYFDSRNKHTHIFFLNEILNATDYVDWTKKNVVGQLVEPSDYRKKGVTFSYPEQEEQPSANVEYTKGTSVETHFDLPTVTEQMEGEYRLVRAEFKYYLAQYDPVSQTGEWVDFAPARDSYTIGDGSIAIVSKFIPVRLERDFITVYTAIETDSYTHQAELAYRVIINKSDFDKLEQERADSSIAYQIRFIENRRFDDTWAFVTEMGSEVINQGKPDEDIIYYLNTNIRSPDASGFIYQLNNVKFELRTILFDRVATVDEEAIIPILNQNGKIKPYIGFDNGTFLFKTGPGAFETYNYIQVSGSHYLLNDSNSNGGNFATKVNSFGLYWDGPEGIVETFYTEFLAFIERTKQVERKVNLTLADLLSFDPRKKIRIRDDTFFVKNIKVTFTMQGIKPATVTFHKY